VAAELGDAERSVADRPLDPLHAVASDSSTARTTGSARRRMTAAARGASVTPV